MWWGPLVRHEGRTARVLRHDRSPVEVDQSMADADPPAAPSLGAMGPWLYEADRAVTRAGLTGAVTAATSGEELEPGLGYVTAGTATDVPFARRYAVRDVLPFSTKVLRPYLRERGITGLTIKKRGIRIDDERLRRDLRIGRGAGDGASTTVLLTRVAGEQCVLVIDPA